VLTATNEVHGPVGLVDTCFSKAIDGLGEFTVNVFDAVLPIVVVPEIVACTAPLVLA
jgi:hypothetical protein